MIYRDLNNKHKKQFTDNGSRPLYDQIIQMGMPKQHLKLLRIPSIFFHNFLLIDKYPIFPSPCLMGEARKQ